MAIVSLREEFPQADDPSWFSGLEKEFRRGWELEKATYEARQRAHRMREAGPRKTVEGLGQLSAIIDGRTYFRWLQQDPDFWKDDANVKKFLNDNPECRAERPEKKASIVV